MNNPFASNLPAPVAEQVRQAVQDALVAQFNSGYSWHDLIDDCDLTPEQKAWAKEHLDYRVVNLDK